jgi:hypothetical protein
MADHDRPEATCWKVKYLEGKLLRRRVMHFVVFRVRHVLFLEQQAGTQYTDSGFGKTVRCSLILSGMISSRCIGHYQPRLVRHFGWLIALAEEEVLQSTRLFSRLREHSEAA